MTEIPIGTRRGSAHSSWPITEGSAGLGVLGPRDGGRELLAHRAQRPGPPRGAIAAALLLAVGVIVSCSNGSERSVEAFCSTLRSEKARILDQFESASAPSGDGFADALSGLGASVQAMGELRTYFRKLERVAPDRIQTEVEIVAESIDRQFDAAKDAARDPLGAFGSALITGFTTSGQMQAVDRYARENCGEGI